MSLHSLPAFPAKAMRFGTTQKMLQAFSSKALLRANSPARLSLWLESSDAAACPSAASPKSPGNASVNECSYGSRWRHLSKTVLLSNACDRGQEQSQKPLAEADRLGLPIVIRAMHTISITAATSATRLGTLLHGSAIFARENAKGLMT